MRKIPLYANRPDNLSCMLASIRPILAYFTGIEYVAAHDSTLPPHKSRRIDPQLLFKPMGDETNAVEVIGLRLRNE